MALKSIWLSGLLIMILHCNSQTSDSVFAKTNFFLAKYVSSGFVDYTLIKQDASELDQLLSHYKKTIPVAGNERKAFLINLYNLSVIKLISIHYPISSPKDVANFFDKKFIELEEKTISLNELENKIIRKDFEDARMHFVLVCGAVGCPPITNFAFTPDKLEDQLDEQVRRSINNEDFIKKDNESKTASLSEIFKWYETDFTKSNANVLQFINKYRLVPIDEKFKIDYYSYDWQLNDLKAALNTEPTSPFDPDEPKKKTKKSTQDYTPSVLYTKGQWEYKFFNNLYSQTKGFDANGNKVRYTNRGSYFSSINQVLVGVNSRFNAGIDFWIKSVRIDDTASSPFQLLTFENNTNSRTALSYIGPKLKIQPFKRLSHLSFQTTFLFPTAKDQEGKTNGKPYLSADSYISITQLFYDQAIGKKFQLFFQIAPWIYIKQKAATNKERYNVSSPIDVFLSFFPTKRLTIYFQEEFWPNYSDTGIGSWFRQEGIGVKFQLIKGKLEAETSYTRFSMGKSAGAGATYNLGIRFIHL